MTSATLRPATAAPSRRHPAARHAACGLLPLALLMATPADADDGGRWVARVGVTRIDPQVRSGDLSAPSFHGTRSDVAADTRPTAGLTWLVNDHLALDLPLSTGFRHDILGDGAIAGTGKLADVQALPATVLLQWRFGAPQQRLRPLVGAGPTYAYFHGERTRLPLTALTGGNASQPTTMHVASGWGVTAQIGATLDLGGRWSLEAVVCKTWVDTDVRLSTGQTQHLRLDPVTTSVGLGYRF